MSKRVLVLADVRQGHLRNVSLEAMGAAKRIAEGSTVIAAVFGSSALELAEILGHHGADKVLAFSNAELDQNSTDAYFQAFKKAVELAEPDVILTGHTPVGRDVSPRVAARLGMGMISDCTHIECNGEELVFTRPIYAGKAFARKVGEGPLLITLRPNNFAAEQPDPGHRAEIQEWKLEFAKDLLRTTIKEVVKKSTDGVDLSEATIIVSGGRGVKSAEGFKPLQELAQVLGAAVGASRGACDSDYCDYALQIGQTGKVVTPDLYIACGISGAIQHLAGMSASKVIVAINKDPEAPIFQVADYGIVGDLFEVVPLLTEEFKKMQVAIH